MEAFESFVALVLEAEGYVVSPAVKFNVRRQTRKAAYVEVQQHGYEVDLVAARADRLVLATVKSFFGSRGVVAEHVTGETASEHRRRYSLLNEPSIRTGVLKAAGARYGYRRDQIELRLYAGRFAAPSRGEHEARIRTWASRTNVGAGPIGVFGVRDVVDQVIEQASSKQYRDNPVLVTLKVLDAAGVLHPAVPEIASQD